MILYGSVSRRIPPSPCSPGSLTGLENNLHHPSWADEIGALDLYGVLPYLVVMSEPKSTTARLEARLPVDVHAMLKRAAEIEDGGRRGKISVALFPNGLSAVTKASGSAQVKPTKELIDRLVHTKVAGIDGFRTIWLGKLETALTQLETAITKYETARAAYDDAFRAEMALRDAHHDLIDKVMGIVRAAFPRDRDVQDVIFPIMSDDTPKKPSERRTDGVATSTNPSPASP